MATTNIATQDYAVFEIVNSKLREIYVGVVRSEALQAIPLRLPPSAPIAHWGPYGPEPVRGIEVALSEGDAHAFAANYVKTELPEGWRFLA